MHPKIDIEPFTLPRPAGMLLWRLISIRVEKHIRSLRPYFKYHRSRVSLLKPSVYSEPPLNHSITTNKGIHMARASGGGMVRVT